jgi:hypothetical protein
VSKRTLITAADRQILIDFLEKHKVSQTRFAHVFGCSKRSVSCWVNGRTLMPAAVASYIRVVNLLTPADRLAELGKSAWKNRKTKR